MMCSKCGIDLVKTHEPIDTVFRKEPLTVQDIPHYTCPHCGEIEIPADELGRYSEKLKQAYRERTDMLQPEEIRALRTQYGLRQAEFEQVIGVSFPTCSRWESGTSLPSLPANKLMQEAIENPPTMRRLMKRAGITPRRRSRTIISLPSQAQA